LPVVEPSHGLPAGTVRPRHAPPRIACIRSTDRGLLRLQLPGRRETGPPAPPRCGARSVPGRITDPVKENPNRRREPRLSVHGSASTTALTGKAAALADEVTHLSPSRLARRVQTTNAAAEITGASVASDSWRRAGERLKEPAGDGLRGPAALRVKVWRRPPCVFRRTEG
jgi:hypothetical protein